MNEPKKISAGTNISWSFEHELATQNWEFVYAIRGSSQIDINCKIKNSLVCVNENALTTKSWAAGIYEWRLYAQKENDSIELCGGTLEIEPDFRNITGEHDPRSHPQRMLESINKVLEGRILSDHERYSLVDGRSLDRIPILELHKLKIIYQRKINSQNSNGSLKVKRVLMRFSK